jgi:hypothetical protein
VRTPFRLLCRCLSGALGRSPSSFDLPSSDDEWAKVLRLSGQHLVTPTLRWALREQQLYSDLSAGVADYRDAVHELNQQRNQECAQQFHEVAALLEAISVQPVLLKGMAAIARGLYPSFGERMLTDLDILVPASRLPDVVETLVQAGYRTFPEHGELAGSGGWEVLCHHYPPLFRPDAPAALELHVQPVDLPFVKLLSSEDVFSAAVRSSWGASDCLVPSPTQFVAHNVIHALLVNTRGKLERVSLRQLFECALAIQKYGDAVDWCALSRRFEANSEGRALRQYLALARACFGQELPVHVQTDIWDRWRVDAYLVRGDLDNKVVEWTINLVGQTKSRAKNLCRKPKLIRKLLDFDFYARWVRSIKW